MKSEKIYLPLVLTLIASISIELVQMSIGRVFDVDDIILNTIGGFLGGLIFYFVNKVKLKAPKFCQKEWFLNTL